MNTPYYLFDQEHFIKNISDFDVALSKSFEHHEIAYSVKTNPIPYIIKTAYDCGCMIEVTSFDEYRISRHMGIPINRIVYNGPYKDKETFIEAVNEGAKVNLECEREIDWLKDCKKDSRVGIRINVDLKTISPDDAKPEEDGSRFGASYENGDLLSRIHRIISCGVRLEGIHVHKTSKTRSADVYYRISQYISSILNEIKCDLEYIDIGGGYYGGIDAYGIPSYVDYANAIKDGLGKWNSKMLIVEPGSAAIAASMSFAMSIIDKKMVGDKCYCVVDGSRIDTDPFFHKNTYVYSVIRKHENNKRVPMQYISGFTCLENDILFSISDENEIDVGDIIEIQRIGAYSISNTPNFIRMLPAIYLKNDITKVIRRRWTAEDFMQGCYYQ